MKKMFSTVEAYKEMKLTEAADRKVLKFLADFRKFYQDFKKIDNRGYTSEDKLNDMYHGVIEDNISKKDSTGIPGLDGKKYDHPID